MKKIILSLAIAGAFLFGTSCSEYLDVNNDPNNPEVVTPQVLLPSAAIWIGSATGGDLQLISSIWSQYYAQNNSSNQYTTVDSYNLNDGNYNNAWSFLYSGALEDLKIASELSAKEHKWQYYIASKVLTAFTFHILTDFYGNVPYTDALLGEANVTPKLDDSKTVIYPAMISMLDDAISKQDTANALDPMGHEDYLYQGDVDSWIKFAKTLKLKLLMRDFDTNKSAIQALLTDGDLLTDDAKLDIFQDAADKSNPLYENDRRKLNTTNNLRGSETLINFLNVNNDPRVKVYFGKSSLGTYLGMPQGSYALLQPTSSFPTYSKATLAAKDPVYFMSEAESYFMQAEAYARLSNSTKAKEMYDAGVTAAFARWGLDASTFISDGGVYQFDASNPLKSIMTQKWVASVRCQAWNTFFDINRTGYPAIGAKYVTDEGYKPGDLTPSKSSVLPAGEYPHRMLYPKRSSDYNPNAAAAKKLGLSAKMWWHK